jgi:hypothetical protein
MGKEDLKKLPDKLTDSEKKKIKNENKAKVVVCRPPCICSFHCRHASLHAMRNAAPLCRVSGSFAPLISHNVHQITSLICMHEDGREERNGCGMKNPY